MKRGSDAHAVHIARSMHAVPAIDRGRVGEWLRAHLHAWYERCTVERMATADPDIARARTLARILDDSFVDPLIGFVLPGLGDVITSVLGLYIVAIALRRRVSPVVIARMLLNLGLDVAIGAAPLLGDVFDFGFRANRRNVALLTDRVATGGRATARDWLAVMAAAAGFVAIVGLVCWAIVALVRAIA